MDAKQESNQACTEKSGCKKKGCGSKRCCVGMMMLGFVGIVVAAVAYFGCCSS